MRKFQLLLYLTVTAFILHTIEEYQTKLYNVDPFIVWFSNYTGISGVFIYLGIQALGFLLIFIMLFHSYRQHFNKLLAIILGLGFLLELLHPYSSIRVRGYYPGLYSGLGLVFIGYFYWKELVTNFKVL